MNYEELVNHKEGRDIGKAELPIGTLYSTHIDGTYANKVELREDLSERLDFIEGLRREIDGNATISHSRQLHFTLDSSIPPELEIDKGRYLTFRQLFVINPALMGHNSFVKDTIESLFDITKTINQKDIYHLCFDPGNVLVRKSDNGLMLMSHGSFYTQLPDQKAFYGNMTPFVAPEVLEGGEIGPHSDVYSVAKFMEWLYTMANMPWEVKRAIKKATRYEPSERYEDIGDMEAHIKKLGKMRKQLISSLAAIVITILIVAAYFWAMRDPVVVDYVKPADDPYTDEMFEDIGSDFDPTKVDITQFIDDSLRHQVTEEERRTMAEYQRKAEEIFRKNYEAEAERILSKIYDDDHMNNSEKNFMSISSGVTEELVKAQQEIGKDANLADATSQRIAAEIIEKVTEQKKANLKYRGIQRPGDTDE